MGRRCWLGVAMAITVALWPAAAWGGMGSGSALRLTELARMRLEAISFFAAILLGSAGLIKAIWNGLRGSFTRLPRLSYGKAVGLVVLWGLLFVVVLMMVAAARELMTPGAWKLDGNIYRLDERGK